MELEICWNIHPGTVDIFLISGFLVCGSKWPAISASVVHYCFLNKYISIIFSSLLDCDGFLWQERKLKQTKNHTFLHHYIQILFCCDVTRKKPCPAIHECVFDVWKNCMAHLLKTFHPLGKKESVKIMFQDLTNITRDSVSWCKRNLVKFCALWAITHNKV